MISVARLEEAFSFGNFFGTTDPAEIDILHAAVERDLCAATEVDDLPPVEAITGEVWLRVAARCGGHDGHRALCAQAAMWAVFRGIEWEAEAHYATGHRGDVVAKDGSLAIECGYTQAGWCLDALAYGQRFAVFPYTVDGCGLLFAPIDAAALYRMWRAPRRGGKAAAALMQVRGYKPKGPTS